MNVGGKTFKVHLDGYNITDALAGKSPVPRREFFYFNDDGSLVGLRYDQWKIVFAEQRAQGLDVWQDPFVRYASPSSSISAPILSRSRTTRASATEHGGSTMPSSSCRQSNSWVSS